MAFSFGAPAAKPLFGAAPAAPAAPLFGQKPAPSLFGQPAAPATTPGLFGAPPAAPPSLFGAQPPPPSLFGSSFGAPTPAPAAGLFGAAPAAAPQSSLFGSQAPAPSLFSQQPPATQQPLFGQSQSAASASLFAPRPAASLFGSQPAPLQQSTLPKLGDPYPPPSPNAETIESRIEKIKDAWDTNSPKCKFQTYFYNVVTPPNVVAQYGRPPGGTDERAWNKAARENPDPDKLVPALAVGFPAIDKRIQAQARQNTAHQSSLTEISAHIATLSEAHSLTTSLRTQRANQTAQALSARLLDLIAKASALGQNRNSSIKQEEEQLRVSLEQMKNGVVEGKGRVNELWSGLGALKARKSQGGKSMEWAVADEEGMRQILEILGSQQAGLDHLTKTLNRAEGDLLVMQESFGLTKRTDVSAPRS